MSEPLTPRKRQILEVLAAERSSLANDLTSADVNLRAFNTRTKVGVCRNELGALERRGLVECVGLTRGEWRITDAGVDALEPEVA
jgi:hypothetical protein